MKRISPWIAGYAILWIVSFIVLWPYGGLNGDAGSALKWALMAIVFCAATWWLTRGNGASERVPATGRMPALQFAALAVCFVGITFDGIAFNLGVKMPWNPFDIALDAVNGWGLRAFHSVAVAYGVANVVVDVLPILAVLLLLGVKGRDLGFGAFRKGSVLVAILWLFTAVVHFGGALASHQMSLGYMGLLWVANFLMDGFPEEAFYRGALLGRLRTVMSVEAALVVQALLFGFMHVGLTMHRAHGNAVHAVAAMIADMSLFGLAMGYLTVRTGNIGIAVCVHFLTDAGVSVW